MAADVRNRASRGRRGIGYGVALIFVFALALRLAAVALFPVPVEKDAEEYDRIAENILRGDGFSIVQGVPSSKRAPLYPLFLAAVYLVFGHQYFMVRVVQAIIGALSCVLVYRIGRRVHSAVVGLAGAGLLAVHPSLLTVTWLYTETLFTFLLTVTMLVFYRAVMERREYLFALLGVCLGLCALTRPTAFFLPLAVLAVLIVLRTARIRSVFVLVAFAMVVSPWTARNYIREGRFVPVSSQGGDVFVYGNYPLFSGTNWWTVFDMERLEEERREGALFLDELRRSVPQDAQGGTRSALRRMALEKIREHPLGYLKLSLSRAGIFWLSPPIGTYTVKAVVPMLEAPYRVLKYLLLGFVLIGGVFWTLRRRDVLPIVSFLAYFTLLHSLVHSIRRYSLPLVPLICVLGALGIWVVWRWVVECGMRNAQSVGARNASPWRKA